MPCYINASIRVHSACVNHAMMDDDPNKKNATLSSLQVDQVHCISEEVGRKLRSRASSESALFLCLVSSQQFSCTQDIKSYIDKQ